MQIYIVNIILTLIIRYEGIQIISATVIFAYLVSNYIIKLKYRIVFINEYALIIRLY